MQNVIKKILLKAIKELTKKIEDDNCELTTEEAMRIMSTISHEPLSKEQACQYLNVSRSRFDDYVRLGRLPKGRKRKGYRELVWYKDELNIK